MRECKRRNKTPASCRWVENRPFVGKHGKDGEGHLNQTKIEVHGRPSRNKDIGVIVRDTCSSTMSDKVGKAG
jgi:hypothetical protein